MDNNTAQENSAIEKRRYYMLPYYGKVFKDAKIPESIKDRKSYHKSYFIFEGEKEHDANVLFFPQNHRRFRHLDVFSGPFFRAGRVVATAKDLDESLCAEYFKDVTLKSLDENLGSEYFKDAKDVIKRVLLKLMSQEESPESLRRFLKRLLVYGTIPDCFDDDDKIEFTRDCLTTLRTRASGDYETVIEVLTNFVSPLSEYLCELLFFFSASFVRYLFECSIKARFNFRSFFDQHPTSLSELPVCPIVENIFLGHYHYIQLFLEFGFERFPATALSLEYEHARYREYLPFQLVIPEDIGFLERQRYKLAMEITFLVFSSLEFFDNRSWTQLARLFWRSIPDPYLCVSDLVGIMSTPSEQEIARIVNKCRSETFQVMFRDAPQPRRLKHLCRCVVRRAMALNFMLPRGLYELDMPSTLVGYLDILASEDGD